VGREHRSVPVSDSRPQTSLSVDAEMLTNSCPLGGKVRYSILALETPL
jgi:hypothetical protein